MLLLLLSLGCLALSTAQNNTICFGATFDTVGNGFEYQARLLQPSGCTSNQTRATRLYIAGACSVQHNNNFNGFPPACPPGDSNILDTSSTTCQHVFQTALPKDITYPEGDDVFDKGHICNNGIKSVLFVQTNCSQLNASSVVLQQRLLGNELCWDGRVLSGGQLAGIVIGSIAGLFLLLSVPLAIHFFLRRRRAKRQAKAAQLRKKQMDQFYSSGFYAKQRSLATGTLHYSTNTEDTESDEMYDAAYDDELTGKSLGSLESQGQLRQHI